MKLVRSILCAVAVLSLYGTAAAANLTFDELGTDPVPVDGLTTQGITFGFTVGGVNSSTEAYYNLYDFGWNTQRVQGAALEGTAAGVLTLNFTSPAWGLSFDAALDATGPVTSGFTVALYDAAQTLLETRVVATNSLFAGSFSEGSFRYRGAPLGRADISFSDQVGMFGVDNLNTVPEPSTVLLLGGGMAGLAMLSRKRRGNKG